MDAADIVAKIGETSLKQLQALNDAKQDLSHQMSELKEELRKEIVAVDTKTAKNSVRIESLEKTAENIVVDKRLLMKAKVKLYGQIGIGIAAIASLLTSLLK